MAIVESEALAALGVERAERRCRGNEADCDSPRSEDDVEDERFPIEGSVAAQEGGSIKRRRRPLHTSEARRRTAGSSEGGGAGRDKDIFDGVTTQIRRRCHDCGCVGWNGKLAQSSN